MLDDGTMTSGTAEDDKTVKADATEVEPEGTEATDMGQETPVDEVKEAEVAVEDPTPELASRERGPSGGMKFAAIAVGLMIVLGAAAGIILLTLADDDDSDDDDDVPSELTVTLDAETLGFVGTPFRFTIVVRGNDTAPTVTWNFGDGEVGTGLSVMHPYAIAGTYTLNATVRVDGLIINRNAAIVVRPVIVPDGILPEGSPPNHLVNLTGVPSLTQLTILGMTEATDLLKVINITFEGKERSFIGLRFLDVLDMMSVRSDAEVFRVIGDKTYESKVHAILLEETSGGNASYLVFAEGDDWLADNDLSTPLMFLGPEPGKGDVVKDVVLIETEPMEILFTGPGLRSEETLSFEEIFSLVQYHNFTVSNGMYTNTWIGFPLWEVLNGMGVLRNATEVVVGASDGYDVRFDVTDVLDNPESDMPFFLAFGMNDEPLPRTEGPYRLIAPDSDYTEDDGHNWFTQSWVKQVSRIMVEASAAPAPPLPWGDPLSGSLTISWNGGSRTYTTQELSMMWDLVQEMDATLVKSTGTMTNGTYAGIELFDLIEASDCPVVPGSFRFVAGDGFSYTADAMELYLRETEEKNATMVALTENGEYITGSKGPLRVVSSALSSKGWVGNLTEIEVKEWSLELDGTMLNLSDIMALPASTVPVSSKGVITNYTGVDLAELDLGRGVGAIIVAGYDISDGEVNSTGYAQSIDLVPYAGKTAGERPFLAYMKEGVRLGFVDKGPVRLIAPGLSSKYWVGSVKEVTTTPLVLMLRNGSTYANLTLSDLMGLPYVRTGWNASVINSTGAMSNVTFTGVSLLDLLDQAFGPYFIGNVTFTLADGTTHSMNWTELSGSNRTAYIAWDLEGQELSLWNGLFALVLSDTSPGDADDWTREMWRYYVVSVEVSL